MTRNPFSIHENAPIADAAAILIDRGVGAVPVLDDHNRPVGVLSRSDIVRYFRSRTDASVSASEPCISGKKLVKEIMTPAVISVPPDAPAVEVVAKMLALGRIHRIFVVDPAGALTGVISSLDVLRKLRKHTVADG
jgi:CBS domain-containing protein